MHVGRVNLLEQSRVNLLLTVWWSAFTYLINNDYLYTSYHSNLLIIFYSTIPFHKRTHSAARTAEYRRKKADVTSIEPGHSTSISDW